MGEQEERTERRKSDRRVLRTKRAINDAFKTLIKDHSIDKITVSALAKEADIDRKTFYLHYASLDELVRATADETIDKLLTTLEKLGEETEESPGNIVYALDSTLREMKIPPERIASSLSIDYFTKSLEDPENKAFLKSKIGPHFVKRFENEAALDYAVHFMLAGSLSAYVAWVKDGKREPIETVARSIDSIFHALG